MRKYQFVLPLIGIVMLVAGPAWAQQASEVLENSTGLKASIEEVAAALAAELESEKGSDTQDEEEDPSGFRVFWRNGLRMETNDGNFQVRLGGRIMYDWVFWGDDSGVADDVLGPIVDGTEFRRARLFAQGYLYQKVEYKAQFDFAGGQVALKDLYMGIRHSRYGFRFGHMKEPFGLEELTSSKYITFIERALPSIFDSSRNSGFMLHGNFAKAGYGVGVFRESGNDGIGKVLGGYNFTARAYGTPLNEDGGRKLFFIGASITRKNRDPEVPSVFRQRPEIHLAPRFISTGKIPAEAITIGSIETALVYGSFSAQAEFKPAWVSAPEVGDPRYNGWYAYGSYWLTGENRAYRNGAFQRVSPKQNFLDGSGGLGAWEVGLRYSMLDLEDEAKPEDSLVQGGRLNNITFGVNWHWNPMTRMLFNFIRSDLDNSGDIWAFLWRAQVDF